MVVSNTGFYFIQQKNNRAIPINDGVIIGRGNDCKIVIKDERVSSNHLQLVVTSDECFIIDLDTKNGTMVNGQRIPSSEKFKLYHNDIIALGKYLFQFVDEKLTTRLGQSVADVEKTCTSIGDKNKKDNPLELEMDKNASVASLSRGLNLSKNSNPSYENEISLNPVDTKTQATSTKGSLGGENEQLLREMQFQRREKDKRRQVKENEIQKLNESKNEFLEKQNEAKEKFKELKEIETQRQELIKTIGNLDPSEIGKLKETINANNHIIDENQTKIQALERQIGVINEEIGKIKQINENINLQIISLEKISQVQKQYSDMKEILKEYRYYNDYNFKELERKLSIKENEKNSIEKEIAEYDEKISHQEKKVIIEREAQRRIQEKLLQKEIVKLQRKLDAVKKGS